VRATGNPVGFRGESSEERQKGPRKPRWPAGRELQKGQEAHVI
jgi:hypothetical protein